MTIQMTTINKLILLTCIICLWNCAGYAPTPARDILMSGQIPEEGYGAYGYLVFTKRPSDSLQFRYERICDAYLNSLEQVSEYNDYERNLLMPTYWLVTDTVNFDKNSTYYADWIEYYDYARAKTLASYVNKLDALGPLLIAWSLPYEKVDEQEEALILDMSEFSDEDIERAFQIWMKQITVDPKIWNEGFNLTMVKERFRNFLEKYGEQIIDSVKTVKDIFS